MIRHICRIENHPIKTLPENIREKYLRGLACVLYNITQGDPTMKMLFAQWAISIMGKDMSNLYIKQDEKCIKKALSLNRVGFHFFRCKHEFFYDCFYLLESYSITTDSSFENIWLPKMNSYLEKVGKNLFTKNALKITNGYFTGQIQEIELPNALIEYSNLNDSFETLPITKILVVATVSAGKSTLINALVGYDFNKVRNTACTSRICYIYNKPIDDGITYWNGKYYEYAEDIDNLHSDNSFWVGLHFQSSLGQYSICLIDTPGVNNSVDNNHWEITTDAIKQGDYDTVLFISNSQYNGTKDERNILEFLHKNCKKPIIFALNQLDCFKSSMDSIRDMIDDTSKELKNIGFNRPEVYPVSALYALLLRREDSLDEEDRDDLNKMRKKFSKEFYNLSRYVGCNSEIELDRTGITYLEQGILSKKKLNN